MTKPTNKTKKFILEGCILLFLFVVWCMIYIGYQKQGDILILNKDDSVSNIVFSVEVNGQNIHAHSEGATVYLFLPSYVQTNRMKVDESIEGVWIDDEEISGSWKFQYDTPYSCKVEDMGEVLEFWLMVKKSQNLNSIFIQTESGSMMQVWSGKEYREAGSALMLDEKGNIVYNGGLEYIKGRGNSTWNEAKKPYTIKLEKKSYLYGMGESKKWLLLANAAEPSKIAYKLSMDMAEALGMAETSRMEWADLYLNGNYAGNYLICEPVSLDKIDAAGQDLEELNENLNGDLSALVPVTADGYKAFKMEFNPDDISGTYLIEKDVEGYYEQENSGFVTDDGNYFSLKYPENASCEQAEYIRSVTQKVEELLKEQDEEVFSYLDKESMALHYLVDGITGNGDMGVTSLYFYKKQGDDMLYVGPVWDYDRSFGHFDWVIYDPDKEMSEYRQSEMISWISYLEENEEFMDTCRQLYAERVRAYVVELVEHGVDEYAKKLEQSVQMDGIRWSDQKSYYESFDANVRYLKFYLCERIRLFDRKFGYEGQDVPEFVGNGSTHQVTVLYGDEEQVFTVEDGECFPEPWEVDAGVYLGWFDSDSWICYNSKLPILEDMDIEALTID